MPCGFQRFQNVPAGSSRRKLKRRSAKRRQLCLLRVLKGDMYPEAITITLNAGILVHPLQRGQQCYNAQPAGGLAGFLVRLAALPPLCGLQLRASTTSHALPKQQGSDAVEVFLAFCGNSLDHDCDTSL